MNAGLDGERHSCVMSDTPACLHWMLHIQWQPILVIDLSHFPHGAGYCHQ